VLASFLSYADAKGIGREFRGVNEKGKAQVTDASLFAEPIQRLHRALASREFFDLLSYVTGTEKLLADDERARQGPRHDLPCPTG
jgi:hypothetical protein